MTPPRASPSIDSPTRPLPGEWTLRPKPTGVHGVGEGCDYCLGSLGPLTEGRPEWATQLGSAGWRRRCDSHQHPPPLRSWLRSAVGLRTGISSKYPVMSMLLVLVHYPLGDLFSRCQAPHQGGLWSPPPAAESHSLLPGPFWTPGEQGCCWKHFPLLTMQSVPRFLLQLPSAQPPLTNRVREHMPLPCPRPRLHFLQRGPHPTHCAWVRGPAFPVAASTRDWPSSALRFSFSSRT